MADESGMRTDGMGTEAETTMQLGTGTDLGVGADDRTQSTMESAHALKERARESGRDLLDQAVEKKDELKARAGTMVDDGRHRVADRAGSLARALHGTADNLEREGDRQLSQWVHQAADQVDRVVGYLDGHDAGGLMRDMEDLARRNPALFLGGTYAAGLVLGRFLRASSPEHREKSRDEERRAGDASERMDTRRAAEEHWPGSTAALPDRERPVTTPDDAGSWTGVGVSRDGFAEGHATGGRTEETLQRGQDLGGTPGYGASAVGGIGSAIPDGFGDMSAGNRDAEGISGGRLGTGESTRYTDGDSEREV